jgi:nicotinamidase-related amidase
MTIERQSGHTGSGARTAVLLIDVINALDFAGSEALVAAAESAALAIESLAARARARDVPVIYANDNFGQWRSDFRRTVEACMATGVPGRGVSHRLQPHDEDYFVLKPMHSSFYCTPLELVLRHLAVERLVLCGFATDLCVLFSAHDAYMRQFTLAVPKDCTAANSPDIAARALTHMRDALGCDTAPSSSVDL